MPPSENPIILLVTDDASEESHTSHILGKYHFDNSLVKLRRSAETISYLTACNEASASAAETVPELIIYSLREAGRLNLSPVMESRRGTLGSVPLIIVVESRDEEEEIRRFQFANTTFVSRPVGFFKLLEAMQKLEMRWMVLRPRN
jgi:DNA-binding response OmpR family regulator